MVEVPHLDYCNVVNLDASLDCRLQLQRLSNACIWYIFGLRKDTSISPYRKKLNWLRVDSRRDYFALLLMYKVVRMKESPILTSLFIPFNSDKPIRGLRKDLDIAAVHTVRGLNSFQVRCAKLWNAFWYPRSPILFGFQRGY